MKVLNLCYSILITLFFAPGAKVENIILLNDSTSSPSNKVLRTDSLLHTIDLLHDKANEIETLSEKGFNLEEIKAGLPQIESDIQTLRASLKGNVRVMDMKSLQTFEALLKNAHKKLGEWRSALLSDNQQLVNMQTEIQELHQSKLLKTFQSDTLFVKLYNTELVSIENSWNKAKVFNSKNLKEISDIQAIVTTYYYQSGDLQKELISQIHDYSTRVTGHEYPYLWQSYDSGIDAEALKFFNAALLTKGSLL